MNRTKLDPDEVIDGQLTVDDALPEPSRPDLVAVGLDVDEDGDPDGCSPYGCRSGEPVVELGDGDRP